MVKCAVVKCRSGFRPNAKERAIIQKGLPSPCKKHVFRFPRKPETRAKWIDAIRRKDTGWNPDNFGVCELHFRQHDFASSVTPRTKTGRKRRRLKACACPSVFDNDYPATARRKNNQERQTNISTTRWVESRDANLGLGVFTSVIF